jgi:hypothetical protein
LLLATANIRVTESGPIETVITVEALCATSKGTCTLIWPDETYSSGAGRPSNVT